VDLRQRGLRRAALDDAGAIARLHVASWQATYRIELPTEFLDGQDVAARAAYWEAEIASPAHVVVADEGGAIAGFVAGGPTRDEAVDASRVFEIYNLHVDPARHGQGIGRSLFSAFEEVARGAGAAELTLWVVETNGNARRFYERQGMQADGARQVHRVGPGAELHEVRYRTRLEPALEPAGEADWKLLVSPEEPVAPRMLTRIGWFALGGAVTVVVGFGWFMNAWRERAAAVAAQRALTESPVGAARQAAERDIQTLLRPLAHKGNIGADLPGRRMRLGLAYGRLALVEERAGDVVKRDRYFSLARRSLREAGVRDADEAYIRATIAGASPSPASSHGP
jgi:ribosomal protein S18 acetylase RimI-like enzyme